MSSLTSEISFAVKFILGGLPAIEITVSTTATSPSLLIGYFDITQPDGIKISGNFSSPNITGSALVYTTQLRLDYLQQFQRGNYLISLNARHPLYTDGLFTRAFNFQYNTVTQVITESLDVFTPLLKYIDNTVYNKTGYSIVSQTQLWTATSPAGAIANSASNVFSLVIGGNYYNATYNTVYATTVIYQDSINTWLTISQGFNYTKSAAAYTPQSMVIMLAYLDAMKASLSGCFPNDKGYLKATALYWNIREKVCAQSTTGLKDLFDEFYRLTHNGVDYLYITTNSPLYGYDFTTGCGGSGGSGGSSILTYSMRATAGVNSFTIFSLANKTILTASRSGISKGITASPTTDTEFLQIVGNVITLPTGDIVNTVVLPDGTLTAELFLFTYQ